MSDKEWKECHGIGEKSAMIFLCILSMIMIPMTIKIIHLFLKVQHSSTNKQTMCKTTISFFICTILTFIALSIKVIYECYGTSQTIDDLNVLSMGSFYALHFLLLILLLFIRLNIVFNASAYGKYYPCIYSFVHNIFLTVSKHTNNKHKKYIMTALSKISIYFFITLCILGVIDGITFAVFVIRKNDTIWQISYFIGTMLIVLTTIWVICLYIYKLFAVIRNSQQHRISTTPSTSGSNSKRKSTAHQTDNLLPTISKYTVNAIFCILSSVLFWITAFLVLTSNKSGFIGLFIYHLCLLINVIVNLICFVLGYGFTNKIYSKYCGYIDNSCRIFCGKLVLLSLGIKWEDAEVHSKPNMSKLQSRSTDVYTETTSRPTLPSITPSTPEQTKSQMSHDDVLV